MKELHLVCNAHLDPVWMWDWTEGASEAISTFYSAVELAEEFDYVFCHNEVLLYEFIGWEKDFYKALTIYFENNKFKNTTSTELISAFEQASGQNLQNFFDSWLKGKVVIR